MGAAPTKSDVLRRLAAALAPDGAVLLGAAETVIGLSDALAPDPSQRGLYVRSGASHRPAEVIGGLRLAASR